ncbi:MAG: hypothetical protein Q9191_005943 [Dirinaria sp. TL-2023a]
MQVDASDEVDDAFPDALREPILRKVQFSTVSRMDHLVTQDFKDDFYPGEAVTVVLDNGDRLDGQIREKTKFPALYRNDGTIERKAFARYFVSLTSRPNEEALVDEDHIIRDRKTFTKQRLRSYLKNSVNHEAWSGAPWIVKSKIAEDFRISTHVPPELTYEHQMAQRKANMSLKKGDHDGSVLNFYPPHSRLPELKPKGGRKQNAQELRSVQFDEYQRALAGNPAFGRVTPQGRPMQLPQFPSDHPGFPVNGFPTLAAKGHAKPPPPPPPPKYPIEDLEIGPNATRPCRPLLKYLSSDIPAYCEPKESVNNDITMDSVGSLLETWNTLNVYCEVFQLDSFTFDDYVEALQLKSDSFQCELLLEIHCSVLKKLVNDANDKNGQVQVTLPAQPDSDDDESSQEESKPPTPTPEPEKPPARSTRSSLAKTEAAELKEADKVSVTSSGDPKLHRAAEMDRSTRGYDWKMRLRKRDFGEGRWVVIIVGLLNQLSGNPRLKRSCDEILAKLAPLAEQPIPETAITGYLKLDINSRVKIIQILCTLSLETKAVRNYMEDCNNQMTIYRKERIDVQRTRKAAVEELRLLHENRKALQPESNPPSPPAELVELEDKMEIVDEDEVDESGVVDTEDEEPHQGRSLRRANDRAAQRKRKQDEDRERKEKAKAEKAKKPSKQEKQLEKVLKKIEDVKEMIKEYEEEVATIENDLREADCPRTRSLGKDRFWNRYYWLERNAMPYAGLPDSSTASAGFANGCIWVQGPDDLERQGFIELSDQENAQYHRAFHMTVPERKMREEGATHVFTAKQWGFYDDPDDLDALIAWLDIRGVREIKLRKELHAQKEKISAHMLKRKEYLSKNDGKTSDSDEPVKRVSTRTKAHINTQARRCLAWKNLTALKEVGHLHSEPKPPKTGRATKSKKVAVALEEEGRQTRATNRAGKPLTRQGTRYSF